MGIENLESAKRIARHSIIANQDSLVRKALKSECMDEFTIDNIVNFDPERNIYEFRLITSWMANKLRDKGEMVLQNSYGKWWCRTTTGQQCHMDSVMQDIAKELS